MAVVQAAATFVVLVAAALAGLNAVALVQEADGLRVRSLCPMQVATEAGVVAVNQPPSLQLPASSTSTTSTTTIVVQAT